MRILMPVLLSVSLAAAPPDPKPGINAAPATVEAIRGCRLDTAKASTLIKALQEMTALFTTDPKSLKLLADSMQKPIEERIRIAEADPRSRRVLESNGLTAKDYTVGVLALRAAVWSLPGSPPSNLAVLAHPANVAMLKAHPDLVQRFNKADLGPVAGAPRPQ